MMFLCTSRFLKMVTLVGSVLALLSTLTIAEPRFLDLDDEWVRPVSSSEKVTVLVVWCSHCPSCRAIDDDLQAFDKKWGDKVTFAVVAPHPADTSQRLREFRKESGAEFPMLRDPSQEFIDSLEIVCTTTTAIYDRQGKLRYLGPFSTGASTATEAVWSDSSVEQPRLPQNGCPIPPPSVEEP